MASRVSFRPRPLDVNKPLCVVKDLAELDSSDALVSRDVTHNHEALDKNNEEVHMVMTDKNRKGKEIPIPQVRVVPTYNQDYLPVYERPTTYVREKGTGSPEDEFVEYDMDTEDEEWLENFNQGQPRLTEAKFERMIWRLEIACANATEKTLRAAGDKTRRGYSPLTTRLQELGMRIGGTHLSAYPAQYTGASLAERRSSAAAASVEHFPHKLAIETIKCAVGGPPPTLQKLYDYWASKRKRKQKPLLRRLQAPTQPADNNPFNVFRPREKIHRPQTRRRRENNTEALSKMAGMKQNMEAAMGVLKSIIQRERCKRNKVKTELEQQLQPDAPEEEVALANQRIFEARQAQWSAEAKDWSRKQNATYRSYRQKHRDKNRDIAPEGALLEEECLKKNLKRKRGGNEIARLPPPPPRMDEGVLFCEEPNLEEVFGSREFVFEATAVNEVGRGRPRFGRGGRLIFDRIDPVTQVPIDSQSTQTETLPLLPMPNLLRDLIYMDKSADGKKQQLAVQARQKGQPPAKQTPGQRDKITSQMGGANARAGLASAPPPGVGKDTTLPRKSSSQLSNLQKRPPGRPVHRKPPRTPNSYQGHGFQVGAIVANGQSAHRS